MQAKEIPPYLLSIIIPVYNTASYIQRCINSIVKQNLDIPFEIIIINDGSTDNSLSIIKSIAKINSSIVVIDKKNEGAGSARNIGIESSKGKYLLFLDSDDYYEPNTLKPVLELALTNFLDLCFFRMHVENNNGLGYISGKQPFDLYTLYNGVHIINYGFSFSSACNCLYSVDFVKKSGVRFINCHTAEDVNFTMKLFPFAKRLIFTDLIVYHYTFNCNSTNRKTTPKKKYQLILGQLEAMSDIKRYLDIVPLPPNIKNLYHQIINSSTVSCFLTFIRDKELDRTKTKDFLKMSKIYSVYPIQGNTRSWKTSIIKHFLNCEPLYRFFIYISRYI